MKPITQHTAQQFADALTHWFRKNKRDLPWRKTHNPYYIWLSEIILQQTRISQGTAYWLRFIEQFPTVEDLAAASEDSVLRLWQGLGYYSRARHLHDAARQIVALGHFPDNYKELRKLSGVGDYTAGAIASVAFSEHVAAVDGNAYRVLSRAFGITTPIDSTEGKKRFTQLDQQLIEQADSASDFNQGMMDLGATVCTPTSPQCATCPLAAGCVARKNDQAALLPVKEKKTQVKTRHFHYVYIACQGYTAIHRRPAGDIWQGLWEPLLIEEEASLPKIDGRWQTVVTGVRHVLTHRVLLADFYRVETDVRPPLPEDFIWIKEEKLNDYARPRLVELLEEKMQQ